MNLTELQNLLVASLFNPWVAFLVIIPAFLGLGAWLMATFFAFVVALGDKSLGQKRWGWAAAILLLGPLAALPFSFLNASAAYVRSVMLKGGVLLLPALFYFGWLVLASQAH